MTSDARVNVSNAPAAVHVPTSHNDDDNDDDNDDEASAVVGADVSSGELHYSLGFHYCLFGKTGHTVVLPLFPPFFVDAAP